MEFIKLNRQQYIKMYGLIHKGYMDVPIMHLSFHRLCVSYKLNYVHSSNLHFCGYEVIMV
jgi:hypothetical protein